MLLLLLLLWASGHSYLSFTRMNQTMHAIRNILNGEGIGNK